MNLNLGQCHELEMMLNICNVVEKFQGLFVHDILYFLGWWSASCIFYLVPRTCNYITLHESLESYRKMLSHRFEVWLNFWKSCHELLSRIYILELHYMHCNWVYISIGFHQVYYFLLSNFLKVSAKKTLAEDFNLLHDVNHVKFIYSRSICDFFYHYYSRWKPFPERGSCFFSCINNSVDSL